MIEINLLPEELQVTEKQITGMRVVLFIGIPVICMLIFFWGWLHFIKLKQAEADLADLTKEEKRLDDEAKAVKELEKEVQKMVKKGQTVVKLNKLRSLDWIRKLMDLTAAVNNTQGWLSDIKVTLKGERSEFSLKCKVVGKNREELAKNTLDFLNHLGYVNGDKKLGFNKFWSGFIMYNPDYYYYGMKKVKELEKVLINEFDMKLQINPDIAKIISVY